MDPAYWQQVGQWEMAEIIELMEWYEARRDQFNQSDEESGNEHRNHDYRRERDWQEHQSAQP